MPGTREPEARSMSAADDRVEEIRERLGYAEKGAFPTAWYGNDAALANTDAVKDLRTLLAEVDRLAARVKELERARAQASEAAQQFFQAVAVEIGGGRGSLPSGLNAYAVNLFDALSKAGGTDA